MKLSRRSMLRGAGGAALALPLLEAGLPRRASAAVSPRRFLVWSTPNGTVPDKWASKVGADPTDFELSEILSPLARHKADMVGVQNLKRFGGYAHEYPSSLTGRKFKDLGYPKIYATGISLDQHIAKKWEGQTPVASLQIGVAVKGGRETISAVSWSGADRPLPAENNPFALFARLFADGAPPGAVKRTFSARRSMLDSVLGDAPALAQRLGRDDRAVVDNYLESVRGIEKQISALEQQAGRCAPPSIGADPTAPGAAKPWWMQQENTAAVIQLQAKLIAAIFACDLTRVVTFTVCGAGGDGRVHSWIPESPKGVDWHGVSHQVEKGQDLGLAAIEKWYSGQLALALDSLKAVTESDGKNLLGNTLVLTNNEYGPNGAVQYLPATSDGKRNNLTHQCKLMPHLLFGQAGGALRTGRWLNYPMTDARDARGIDNNRLLVSILNALGIDEQTFGDPAAQQGPLAGLLG